MSGGAIVRGGGITIYTSFQPRAQFPLALFRLPTAPTWGSLSIRGDPEGTKVSRKPKDCVKVAKASTAKAEPKAPDGSSMAYAPEGACPSGSIPGRSAQGHNLRAGSKARPHLGGHNDCQDRSASPRLISKA
jgi:hypothetical protein